MSQIEIDGRLIGDGIAPYVIAEMSANHNSSIDRAREIITQARLAGANAVKLQTYRADTLTFDSDAEEFKITGGLWDGLTLYELYEQAHMPWDWQRPLFQHARQQGITIFSTPFDTTAVDLLEDLNSPAYKIASFEIVDLPLIRYAAGTGKPIIISTGMASFGEIEEAVDAARSSGCTQLALLHCVSGYPAPAREYNLYTIRDMAERFNVVVGLSDHTLSNVTATTSVALGASIIEKHFTLDRSGGGPDDSFSLEPKDLSDLCRGSLEAFQALGSASYDNTASEKGSVKHRRSLYFVKSIKAGEQITKDHIKSIRPGLGMKPKYTDDIVGRQVSVDIDAGTPTSRDLLI